MNAHSRHFFSFPVIGQGARVEMITALISIITYILHSIPTKHQLKMMIWQKVER
jgi:hypothetical protein